MPATRRNSDGVIPVRRRKPQERWRGPRIRLGTRVGRWTPPSRRESWRSAEHAPARPVQTRYPVLDGVAVHRTPRRAGRSPDITSAASVEQRFRRFTDEEIRFDAASGRYVLGPIEQPDGSFPDPNFHMLRMNASAVFRWEYLPGSTIFLVWQHEQRNPIETFEVRQLERLGDLFSDQSTGIFLIKVSHWLGS